MKFKITYQKNKKLFNLILESNNYASLQKMENFPSNVIKVRVLKSVSFDLLKLNNSKKEVLEFFTQLDILLSANLTFSQSIDLLSESNQENKIEEIITIIKQSISSSTLIDKALLEYKDYLGEVSLLFLKLGFENGNIKDSIHSLVEILDEEIKSKEKLSEVMRYPLILVFSLCISIGMIFVYVLPNFEFIFRLLKDEIPFSTYLLITIKEILEEYVLLLSIFIVIIALFISYLIKKYRFNYDKTVLLKIPLLSSLIQSYYFYRLFLSLSIIVRSKYQFQIAIENTKNMVGNLYIQKTMERIILNIKNGISISESFERSALFDKLTMKLLNTADNTNNYESILGDIAIQHKKRFQRSLKNFSSTIEPLLIFLISLIVLWLILAIMLPIWNLGTVIN